MFYHFTGDVPLKSTEGKLKSFIRKKNENQNDNIHNTRVDPVPSNLYNLTVCSSSENSDHASFRMYHSHHLSVVSLSVVLVSHCQEADDPVGQKVNRSLTLHHSVHVTELTSSEHVGILSSHIRTTRRRFGVGR